MISHKNFADSMQAKRFLVSRIVEEARRQNEDLPELEEKMLYFSESFPTLPDMPEIAEKFADEVDEDEYYAKIARHSKNAYAHDRKEDPELIHLWKEAIEILKTEDHLLSAILRVPRPVVDILWLIFAGIGAAVILLALVVAASWMQENLPFQSQDKIGTVSIVLVAVGAGVMKFTPIGKTVGNWLGDIADKLVDRFMK